MSLIVLLLVQLVFETLFPRRSRQVDGDFSRKHTASVHDGLSEIRRLIDGVVIPHGIFDRKLNLGHVNLGLSRDTSEFACDSFRWYWNRIGKQRYPDATSILWTCDGSGSNSSRKYILKYNLERLSESIGLPIRVAHYPPYCSKYNSIERRFFPHLARACSGMLFDTIDTVVNLMRRAATATGLRTTVY